ncbi:MAG: hypothetical protein ACRDJ4_03335 [Actinomycetota bacterium]
MTWPAAAVSAHFIGEPDCSVAGDSLVCTFSIAGLGKGAVDITVDVPAGCANKPGHEPPCHASATLENVKPRAGRVTATVVIPLTDCPPGLISVIGDEATVTVTSAKTGEVLFEETVPIT